MFSEVLNTVSLSATIRIADMARALKKEGKDVISLSVGEPDFKTPQPICDAAIKAMNAGHTKYTALNGILELRQAICDKLARDNQLNFSPSEIIVSTGAKQAIFNALFALLNPGDEVVVVAPYWVSYPDMVSLCRGKPVICPFTDGLAPDIEAMKGLFNSKTKCIILNSPSNPSGFVYQEETLKALADILRQHPDVFVISDDIYEYINYCDEGFKNILNVAPDLRDRVIVVNGVSKNYAMTGWRLGYAAANAEVIKKMSIFQSQVTSCTSAISQYAALEAIANYPMSEIKKMVEVFRGRRDLVTDLLSASTSLIKGVPLGAFYVMLYCGDYVGKKTADGRLISNDIDFTEYLLNDGLVAVVPGSEFGAKNYIRISYALSEDELKEASRRIAEVCNKLS